MRYRKNVRELPGCPDIVFVYSRVVVFCDGDFWHGRNWEERRRKLEGGANAGYWIRKIESNMERDRRVSQELLSLGWRVVRFWESEIVEKCEAIASDLEEIIRNSRVR